VLPTEEGDSFNPRKNLILWEKTYSEICQANYIFCLRQYTDLNVMLDIDVCTIYITFPAFALLTFSGNCNYNEDM
jgi:hypothetical protein